jgi:cytochrome P450
MEYNPFSRETQSNPFPVYQWLRDEAPVYHNPDIGFYALTRFEDVLRAHLDVGTYKSSFGITIEGLDLGQDLLINKDDPEHKVHRKLVSRVFTPRAIDNLEPSIRRAAGVILDEARERGELDIVSDFSAALPMLVIAELLGVPADIRTQLRAQSDRVLTAQEATANPSAPNDAYAALAEMRETLADTVAKHAANPGDDVLSLLVTSTVTDDDGNEVQLTQPQVIDRLLEMIVAGHETTAKLIANGVVALSWYPDQRAELVADRSLIPGAVEEMLRWDPPSHYQGRWVTEPVTLHGCTIPADSRVILVTGAANHDHRIFADPELFNIHRKIDRHVGFGFGAHLCIGAALARLETVIAFDELLTRFPNYELSGPIVRTYSSNVRGLAHLPIAFDNAA